LALEIRVTRGPVRPIPGLEAAAGSPPRARPRQSSPSRNTEGRGHARRRRDLTSNLETSTPRETL